MSALSPTQEATRIKISLDGGFENATPSHLSTFATHQDGDRTKRAWLENYHQEARHLWKQWFTGMGKATTLRKPWDAWHQDGVPPPAGITLLPGPVVPPPVLCYTPNGHLLFSGLSTPFGNLVFICDNHTQPPTPGQVVVVPVRRIYMVVNDASLRRVDGNIHLPTFGMSLSLDTASWTWGFSATLPTSALASLEPSVSGAPVEVEATINGVAYRALVESVSTNRAFNSATLSVQGRGKTALLDAPYSPVMAFGNTQLRTAQQLMDDVLTFNLVSLGWSVNWGLTDWDVPTGVFSYQGSYMGALNTIAGAVGAYIQPHPTGQSINVLHQYPTAPWDWAGMTPDYELPVDVTTQESITWETKPLYNKVFVSGVQQGIIGEVLRAGTAGDLIAPMVTDPLITQAAAARQRGVAILSNTGRIANVGLKIPVLPETGIITPGKFVRYVDGSTTRTGIVRSVNVQVGLPEIFQTIGVETHVY